MIVLAVLVGAPLGARALGLAVDALDSWPAAVRAGLSAMFLFTSPAHCNAMRFDVARMMPPGIPRPMAMVDVTGACEILGAIGLPVPATRRIAAAALILFLAAVFPANVRAAREGLTIGGRSVTPLRWRLPMQLLFIGLTWWAGIAAAGR